MLWYTEAPHAHNQVSLRCQIIRKASYVKSVWRHETCIPVQMTLGGNWARFDRCFACKVTSALVLCWDRGFRKEMPATVQQLTLCWHWWNELIVVLMLISLHLLLWLLIVMCILYIYYYVFHLGADSILRAVLCGHRVFILGDVRWI